MNRQTATHWKPVRLFALCGAGMIFSAATFAAGQTSANFAMPRDTLNAGAAGMSSASYRLSASIGDAMSSGTITSVSFQLSNGFRAGINASPAVLALLSVVSRKFHAATPFNLTIDHTQPLNGTITIEPREIGGGHTLVFHFDNTVTSVGAVTALDALTMSAATVSFTFSGPDVFVTLTNVADNKRLTITLNGLNGSASKSASMGFLVGDVTNSGAVNAADIAALKANLNKPLDNVTYKFDLNASGQITPSDLSAAKARSGRVLPP